MPHAFILELTPSQGHPRPEYLSQYAHGLFFYLLKAVSPELSQTVHEAQRKPFTLSAIRQREGVTLRVTTLDDALFKPLLQVVLKESLTGLELGQDHYRVVKVLATPEGHRDAGYTSWEELHAAEPLDTLNVRFLTPTVFTTSRSDGKRHYTPLPEPRLVLKSLLSSYQTYSPKPYSDTHAEALTLAFDEHMAVLRYNLCTGRFMAGKNPLTGFTGTVTLRYLERTMEVRRALGQLAILSFYSGVGAKTPYGMGQVRLLARPVGADEEAH
jgi:CRISPR-associated endoribonuclease Cas6